MCVCECVNVCVCVCVCVCVYVSLPCYATILAAKSIHSCLSNAVDWLSVLKEISFLRGSNNPR